MDIRLFLWTHPWWHAALVLVPPIVLSTILALRELHHSKEANRLHGEANDLTDKANGLLEEQKTSVARIAELQDDLNKLQAERNQSLVKIADNTKKPVTLAEKNAAKLLNHLGETAYVTNSDGSSWGSMGAVIAEVNDDILTLFVPASQSSSRAFGVCVQCDKLHLVEVAAGGCPVQITILERYGNAIDYGEAKSWARRSTVSSTALPRGNNVFQSSYRLEGSSKKRGIFIYAPTTGNPQYTLVTFEDMKETGALYGGNIDISKKFAVLQIEWLAEGFVRDGGGMGGSNQSLFLFTH
jgi:hypothetical protein